MHADQHFRTKQKTMGSPENYVCTLDEASLKKAGQELNEDPADRMNAVEAFRNLIKTRAPHIRCSMGKYVCVCACVRVCVCVCVYMCVCVSVCV